MSGRPDTQQAEVTVRPSRYTVSALPGGGINSSLYSITVEERGQLNGQVLWSACWMGRCLNAKGRWDYEPIPSSRTDKWIAKHRFNLDTALALAKEAALLLEVNGLTVADAVARSKEQ